jgi:hypothetical protein
MADDERSVEPGRQPPHLLDFEVSESIRSSAPPAMANDLSKCLFSADPYESL